MTYCFQVINNEVVEKNTNEKYTVDGFTHMLQNKYTRIK